MGETSPSQENISALAGKWVGTVTITRQGGAFMEREHSTSSRKERRYKNHTLNAGVTMYACGDDGYLCVYGTSWEYSENYEHKNEKQDDHELCSDGTKKSPGDSSTDVTSYTKKLYDPQNQHALNEKSSVMLMMLPGGAYQITALSKAYIEYAEPLYSMSEDYYACSDNTQKSETHTITCAIGEEGWTTKTSREDNTTVLTSVTPPETCALAGSGQGMVQNNTLSGRQVVYEQKAGREGDFSDKVTMSWHFTKAGPLSFEHCVEMCRKELEEAIKKALSEPDPVADLEDVDLQGLLDCYKKNFDYPEPGDESQLPLRPLIPFRACIRENSTYDPNELTPTRENMLELEIKAAVERYFEKLSECRKKYLGCLDCKK